MSVLSVLVTVASYIPTVWSGGGIFAGGGEWHFLFDVAVETSVPTTWSTMLMTAGAVLCGLCAWLVRRRSVASTWAWGLLAVGLAVFAVDESSSLHERLPLIVERLGISSSFHCVWLTLGIPLAVAVVAGVVLCARRLPRTAQLLLVSGIAVFFLGAIGVEMLTGETAARAPEFHREYLSELIHTEELLEMLGLGVAICAPLSALRVHTRIARRSGTVVPTTDTGSAAAGAATGGDAATSDAAMSDTGMPDAAMSDAAMSDAGNTDAALEGTAQLGGTPAEADSADLLRYLSVQVR